MESKDNYSGIASLIGADDFANLVHENGTKYLTDILNEQPEIKIPDFSEPVNHGIYLKTREQLGKSTTLAAITGDTRLVDYVNQWTKLQQGYAQQVINQVNKGISEQKEFLEAYDQDLKKGEDLRRCYKSLGKRFLELNDKEQERLLSLREKIKELDKITKEREQLCRTVAGISKVEQTLASLIESGYHSIHYIVPSVDEAQQQLGINSYDGPVFDPFLVSNKATAIDMFRRETGSVDIQKTKKDKQVDFNLENLPPTLLELVKIYEHIGGLSPGTNLDPNGIKGTLGIKEISVKGMGSYFEDHAILFGVQRREVAGSRSFVRQETGTVVNRKSFLEQILHGKLQSQDTKKVNEFYFQQALALLREDSKAYAGFTKEHVHRIVEEQGMPVTKVYLSRNLKKSDDLKVIDLEGQKKFVFQETIPTKTQEQRIQEALKQFGIDRFSPRDLTEKISESHSGYRIHQKVITRVMGEKCKEGEFRFACDEPLTYQRKDRSMKPTAPKQDKRPPRLM